MAYVYLIYGVVLIVVGFVIKNSENYWLARPPQLRPVDIEKYTRLKGFSGIAIGFICTALALWNFAGYVHPGVFLALITTYFIVTLYCEKKFGRKK